MAALWSRLLIDEDRDRATDSKLVRPVGMAGATMESFL